MPITKAEREKINRAALFLAKRGYSKTENPYSIKYKLDNVSIDIVYPPNSAESEVNIRFINKNKVFSVGWIALVRENVTGSTDKLSNVKELLRYIEIKFFQITDYKFCQESNSLIDQYADKHQFENLVAKFLKL